MPRPRRPLRALGRNVAGASAIEFAIFAPILVGGLLAMTDVGLAVGVRMELDRLVRSGAQAAMSLNNDAGAIAAIVRASAAAPEGLEVDVSQNCACGDTTAACSALCPGGLAPAVFFDIAAARSQQGFLLGERQIVSSTRVQLR